MVLYYRTCLNRALRVVLMQQLTLAKPEDSSSDSDHIPDKSDMYRQLLVVRPSCFHASMLPCLLSLILSAVLFFATIRHTLPCFLKWTSEHTGRPGADADSESTSKTLERRKTARL
jgi:hypothetical protein